MKNGTHFRKAHVLNCYNDAVNEIQCAILLSRVSSHWGKSQILVQKLHFVENLYDTNWNFHAKNEASKSTKFEFSR